MGNSKLSRRDLFSKIIGTPQVKGSKEDPLFEKYKRNTFGRKYEPAIATSEGYSLSRVTPLTSGLNQYTGPWTDREAIHLLKRTGFGVTVNRVNELMQLSFNDALNAVVNINPTLPPPPVNTYSSPGSHNQPNPDPVGIAYNADWTESPSLYVPNVRYHPPIDEFRQYSLDVWHYVQYIRDNTLKEKLTLFWYHFIPVNYYSIRQLYGERSENASRITYRYSRLLRSGCNGNFKTLIRNIATAPAMMYYLNNDSNSKNNPDENFAREVMELFTIGKDVPNSYTQADVVEAAKVLTGWRVVGIASDNGTETVEFVPELHDESTKQFSAFFNNTVIPNSGAAELDLFIDMLFSKSEIVSQYIVRKMYRFFVYYDIDAAIEQNIIVPLAQLFVASNWEIAPVINKLFRSEHFFDMANRGVIIKSPFDLLIGFFKNSNTDVISTYDTEPANTYGFFMGVNSDYGAGGVWMGDLGQVMGRVPTVSGWVPFYQNPNFHQFWINSDTVQKRQRFLLNWMDGYWKLVNPIVFAQQFANNVIEDPNLLIEECFKYLLPVDLSIMVKNEFKTSYLLSGQASDYYWTDAWSDYIADPNNDAYKSIVESRLKNLLIATINLPEYQLI